MLQLQTFDSKGTELHVGDLVALQDIRNRGYLTFYTKVQVLNGELYPFNKFAYDRILKVDEIPPDCKHHLPADNAMYEYWMHPKIELMMAEEKRLEKWRMDYLFFEVNKFYKVKNL